MKISFIQTGGSIDKDYKETAQNHGYNFEIADPAVEKILLNLKPNFEYEILTVAKKDSLDLTDQDRQKILTTCQELDNDKIIITHGTDTFKQTATVLDAIKDKVVILTGSMKPEKFQNSDADFNVGMAVGAINFLEKGIYIAIDGLVYPWQDYLK